MTSGRKLAVAGSLLAAATVAVVLGVRTNASEKGALARLSNQGRQVAVHRDELTRRLGVRGLSLLSVRNGRAYYAVDARHASCVAAGPVSDLGELGTVECPRGPFPTAERPVVDLSVYEATSRERREVSLFRAEGLAADGVAAVIFLRPDGSVALQVAVTANVFSAQSVPAGPIAGLAAVDAAGNRIWQSP